MSFSAHHHLPGQQAYYPQYQASAPAAPPGYFDGWVNFGEGNYVKGFVIGAVLGFLVANPTVQKAVVRGAATIWYSVMGGMEELKEQARDVRAEMEAATE
ncbi:MAG: YtxH domain-containing protein [Thermodesulfobacteriota bacterium]